MKRSHKKHIFAHRDAQAVALVVALVIGIILLVAAYAKLFYPAESLKTLER